MWDKVEELTPASFRDARSAKKFEFGITVSQTNPLSRFLKKFVCIIHGPMARPSGQPRPAGNHMQTAARPPGHGHPATATTDDPSTKPRPRPPGHGHGHPATATATRPRPTGHGHPATAIRPRPGHGTHEKNLSSLII